MAKIDVKAEGEEVVIGIGGDRETRLTLDEAEEFGIVWLRLRLRLFGLRRIGRLMMR